MHRLTPAELVAVAVFAVVGALGALFAVLDWLPGVIAILCVLALSSAFLLLRRGRGLPRFRLGRRRPVSTAMVAPVTVRTAVHPRRVVETAGESEDNPTLSIVMPVHNVAPYLESALLSVLYQSFQDFELIIVDDASTDGSRAIIDMYARLDPRIRVLSLEHNSLGGAGIPSNMGVRFARGKYLGFVDSDDVLTRGAFARLVENAELHDAEVVIGGFVTFTDDENVLSPAYDVPRSLDIPRHRLISATSHPTLLELSPVPWRKLYLMSFVKKFGIEYPEGDFFFEDNPLHWAVLSFAERVVLIDDTISRHRTRREGQTTGSVDHRKGALADHLATAMRFVLATEGDRRAALLEAYVDRLYGSRWVVREQSHSGAQAMLAKRFAALFDRAIAEGARIPLAMRRTVESYRGSYPTHDLTIVISVFNSATKVRRTLDSALAVRRITCDVLIVDDGSTDKTMSVLRDYESAHANVHVFSQPHRGAGRARNAVIPLITGRYALMVEAGDRVDAAVLSASVQDAVTQDLDLLFFGSNAVSSAAPSESSVARSDLRECTPATAAELQPVAWNRLIRTAHLHDRSIFFGGSDPYEDILFHWESVVAATRTAAISVAGVQRTDYTRKRLAKKLANAHGDALHDALWYTHTRIEVLPGYESVKTVWMQYVANTIAATRAQLPPELITAFDARSEILWDDLADSSDAVTVQG